jgi:hypothetical protein
MSVITNVMNKCGLMKEHILVDITVINGCQLSIKHSQQSQDFSQNLTGEISTTYPVL